MNEWKNEWMNECCPREICQMQMRTSRGQWSTRLAITMRPSLFGANMTSFHFSQIIKLKYTHCRQCEKHKKYKVINKWFNNFTTKNYLLMLWIFPSSLIYVYCIHAYTCAHTCTHMFSLLWTAVPDLDLFFHWGQSVFLFNLY